MQPPTIPVLGSPSLKALPFDLTVSDRRLLDKVVKLRRQSSARRRINKASQLALQSGVMDVEIRRVRRQASTDKIPRYVEAHTESLSVTLFQVHNAVENAYFTGGRSLKLLAGEKGIDDYECEGLGGCSRYAFNSIIFPIQSVQEILKTVEMDLENWAFKARRMAFQQKMLGM